jgi:Lar family restriction alleviation protein
LILYYFRRIYISAAVVQDRGMIDTDFQPLKPEPILPCPFCGREPARVIEIDVGAWSAMCEVCGSNGPNSADEESAVHHWNERRTLAKNLGLMRTVAG